MELKADLGEGEQGLVELSLGDLIVQYDKSNVYETNIQVRRKNRKLLFFFFFQNFMVHPSELKF